MHSCKHRCALNTDTGERWRSVAVSGLGYAVAPEAAPDTVANTIVNTVANMLNVKCKQLQTPPQTQMCPSENTGLQTQLAEHARGVSLHAEKHNDQGQTHTHTAALSKHSPKHSLKHSLEHSHKHNLKHDAVQGHDAGSAQLPLPLT